MQLANIVRERWKGVLFCLIIAIPATLLGKQVEVVGGPVFAILFGMVLALVFPKNRREQLAAGVTYTSKKVLQYAVILLGFGMNLSQILSKGAQSLPIIVATISTSLVIAFVLCRVMNGRARSRRLWVWVRRFAAVLPSLRPHPSSMPTIARLPRLFRSSSCLTLSRRSCFRRSAACSG